MALPPLDFDYVVKDSGQREEFTTGARRDTQEGKPRYNLHPPRPLYRTVMQYTRGAEKYGEGNWEKGMPFSRVMDSLMRHVEAYRMGNREEDHLAAIVFNANCLMDYEERIKEGLLPTSLDDLTPKPWAEAPPFRGVLKSLIESKTLPPADEGDPD